MTSGTGCRFEILAIIFLLSPAALLPKTWGGGGCLTAVLPLAGLVISSCFITLFSGHKLTHSKATKAINTRGIKTTFCISRTVSSHPTDQQLLVIVVEANKTLNIYKLISFQELQNKSYQMTHNFSFGHLTGIVGCEHFHALVDNILHNASMAMLSSP